MDIEGNMGYDQKNPVFQHNGDDGQNHAFLININIILYMIYSHLEPSLQALAHYTVALKLLHGYRMIQLIYLNLDLSLECGANNGPQLSPTSSQWFVYLWSSILTFSWSTQPPLLSIALLLAFELPC